MSTIIATGTCWSHGGIFEFHPDYVCTLMIDPLTNAEPEPNRVTAARQVLICDECVIICDECVEEANVHPGRSRGDPHQTAAELERREGGWT